MLLNLLKDIIEFEFEYGTNAMDKENELKQKIKGNEVRIRSKVLELNAERENLQDKIDDIESAIVNIETLLNWAKT